MSDASSAARTGNGVNAPAAVRHLVEEYRRFLRTTYRFLDPRLRSQFEVHLARADVVVRGPYVTLARDFTPGPTLRSLVDVGDVDARLLRATWPFGDRPLYKHQHRALEAARTEQCFVVTTGTGSGKTEAFLLPILNGILQRKRAGHRGVQAILIYPMNALANDQLERMRRLLRGSGVDVSFALYTGDSETAARNLREEPTETERVGRAKIRTNPPDILLTNYKQLEFLLVRQEDRALFTPSLRYLVLDELHSYRGALATEVACLIRRLKAHAGVASGSLLGIGTSATVASGDGGPAALARFASDLYGEAFSEDDILGESFAPWEDRDGEPWVPPLPSISEEKLAALDVSDETAVAALIEHLCGKPLPPSGALAERIRAALRGNAVVRFIEQFFTDPHTVEEAAEALRAALPAREDAPPSLVRREIEAYLIAASIGDEAHPPRLRPKLHTFFHGVYDVSLCLNPDCRALVPQGGAECPKCGSVARPAALCRTCGQDFVKVRFEREDDNRPVGTGDFYSDDRTAFLTWQVHELPEKLVDGDSGDEDEEAENAKPRRRTEAEEKLDEVWVCLGCGRVLSSDHCEACNRQAVRYLLHRGPLHKCPACGDTYTRYDIVAPLRTGTASTVSVLATHHLDHLEGDDRKLLVFADNRQDAAHQAGYTADKNRSFALRHLIAQEVRDTGSAGLYLQELPERLFDGYRRLGILPPRPTRPEREKWLFALTYEAANEVTRFTRQRAALETLGLVGVDYEFLDEVGGDDSFRQLCAQCGLDAAVAVHLVRAVLDTMRRNRAVDYGFFLEYVDPNKKRRYRELEAEPYSVRFPERDRSPKAFALDRPDHIRKAGRLDGFFQENLRAGQLTATQKLVKRVVGSRDLSEQFLRGLVPLLVRFGILVHVPAFPIPAKERTAALKPLQINHKVIRLTTHDAGFRCNACQVWRPYPLPTCPTPKCEQGTLQPVALDLDNYYVRLYRDHAPRRLAVAEHSAHISGEERAKRETAFKEGRLDVLMSTPTLELGVDIGPLLTVVLRNAPPTPANYIQRVGRAGRRLRIGFVSTFCAGGAHDRHAFEDPRWLVSGNFTPARVRLDNPKVVHRHLRSFALEGLSAQLPARMGEFLDDIRQPTRWDDAALRDITAELRVRRDETIDRLAALFGPDREVGRTSRYDRREVTGLVDRFSDDLSGVFTKWWGRVEQLDREYREYSTVGSARQDEKKAAARKRAYYEITQDPERSYTLNYLATQGLLPAYQFPVDTFSLDPGVADTPTLYRPSAIALEEFAPGNFVYANGHKLRSIRVLFAGGPAPSSVPRARSDAEASGRLRSFHFCDHCDEATEETRNTCARCGADLPTAVDTLFVDAFEAEESLRIGSEEESRQQQRHLRREHLVSTSNGPCRLYEYPFAPVEYRQLASILVTNWGKTDSKTGDGTRFWLCPDCGRHQPHEPSTPEHADAIAKWREGHARYCSGQPVPLILGYRFETDCLVVTLPARADERKVGKWTLSSTLVTVAEALLAGAGSVLELEPRELQAFVRRRGDESAEDQIVIYETAPGGAGYVEDLARRLPEVAEAARRRLYGHTCYGACYLCLKHYANQRWHAFFDKDAVRDILLTLSQLDPVPPVATRVGAGVERLKGDLAKRAVEVRAGTRLPGTPGPQSPIEWRLLEAIRALGDVPEPVPQFEVRDGERLVTVPDFAYPEEQIAIFCDGFAFHGTSETLEMDARKRNFLQSRGWVVLTYWGATILRDAAACAREVAALRAHRRGHGRGAATDIAGAAVDGGAAALVAYVREQLGDTPWVQIVEAIADALQEDDGREFTLPDLVHFAEECGFAWNDVHVVVEKLALAPRGFLERVFLSLASDPPVVVPAAEVARRLRQSLEDPDGGRRAWLTWAKGVKVVWRRSSPAGNPSRAGR